MLRDANRPSGGLQAEPADYLSEASPWGDAGKHSLTLRA